MKEILIRCQCFGEVLSLTRFEDETEIYFTVYKHNPEYSSLFRRIKMAIKVLRGKGIETADIVLSKEDFEKIKQF